MRHSDPGLDVVCASGALSELPLVINGSKPGLLVIDSVDAAGLDAIERFALTHPEVDTIVVSNDASPAFLLQAMRAGVREVLPPSAERAGAAGRGAAGGAQAQAAPAQATARARCSPSSHARAAAAPPSWRPTLHTARRRATS